MKAKPIVRIGEATNPGPCDRPQQREGSMELEYADPGKEGFWGATTPEDRAKKHRNTEPSEDKAKDKFQLIVDVCNGTAWGTVAKYLTKTRAHLVLVQEHHLPTGRVAEASQWALRHGWRTIWAPAEEGDGGWRAGVCICARDPVAISAPRKGGAIVSDARVVAALAEAPGYRPTTVYSVYLKDGEGLSWKNLSVLADLGQHVRMQGEGSPFIAGGDLQMPPQAIAAAGIADRMHATIVATGCKRGTCRTPTSRSEIDYYIIEQGLARGIQAVETVEATCIHTHVPVRLTLHPRLTSAKALVIRKPPPLKVERVYGPTPQAPSWTTLRAWAEELAHKVRDDDYDYDRAMEEFEEMYEAWADVAEGEIEGMTGDNVLKRGLRGRRPKMVWRSVVPEKATKPEGGTAEALRWLAMLAHELRDAGSELPRRRWHREESVETTDGGEAEMDEMMAAVDADKVEAMNKVLDVMIGIDDPPEAIVHVIGNGRRADERDGEVARAADEVMRAAGKLMEMLRMQGGRGHEGRNGAPVAEEVDKWDTEAGELELRIGEMASEAEKDNKRRDREGWTEWIRANIEAGARNAHRFLRLPMEWQPTCALTIDGIVTADPLKVLSGYADKYIRLWDDDDGDEEYVQDLHGWGRRCSLPRPSPGELREASKCFKERTLVAYDGFHPRHYNLLCDEALEMTAAMMEVSEVLGALPPQLRLLAMPLIPKPRTGHRAVAAFVSFYRLWAKVRKPHIEKWEAEHDRPYLAAGKDRSPSDVVWRQAARAETEVEGKNKGGAAGGLLWDMSTFFERLNRRKLRRRLVALDFPMPLARLAMAAYAGPRVLSMTGAISQPIFSWRGVAAGCGLAVAFTRAYYIPPFDHMVLDLRSMFGRNLLFDAYFDDVVVNATGTAKEVEYALGEAHVVLADVIEDELNCSIEMEKAAVVASSRELAARLVKRIGRRAGGQKTSAINLGIDYAPGRRRSAHGNRSKRADRFHGLARKMIRFKKLCKVVGTKASKIFIAGPLPYAVYGSVVNGMTDAETHKIRKAIATAWSPRARGRSLRMITLLNRAPTHTAENGAALQYCREVWRASLLGAAEPERGELTLRELSEAWHAIEGKELVDPATGKRRWNLARGPIANAVLTFNRLGWSMKGPFEVTNDHGESIALTANSPAMLARMMHEATMRQLERQVGARLCADGHEEFSNRRACLDQVRTRLRGDAKMTKLEKAAYRSVLCDAVMTCNKACRMGYLVNDECAKCGKKGDTVFHRVWSCDDPEVVAARDRVAPRWLQEEAKRRGAGSALYTKGLFPNPADDWPRPTADAELHMYAAEDDEARREVPGDADATVYEMLAKQMDEWRPSDEMLTTEFVAKAVTDARDEDRFNRSPKIQLGGRLYVDGSCTQQVFAELRRAAAGLVVRRPNCAVEARYLLPVWSPIPQSSQSAEYIAVVAPMRNISSATVMVSDCLNVVKDFGREAAAMVSGKRRYAGLMRHAWAVEDRRHIEVCKTKAHRAVGSLQPGLDREDAIGNAAADRAAKEAVNLHPKPSPAQEQELASNCKRAALIIRTIGATMSTFKPMPRERMQRRPVDREGAGIDGAGGHQWAFLHGMWRCRRCHKCATANKLEARRVHEKCDGLRDRHTMEGMASKGHDVVFTGGEIPITFCAKCGAFSWRRSYGLATRCPRVPTAAGKQALVRLRQGLVPWINAREAHLPRRRIDVGAGGIWSEADGEVKPFNAGSRQQQVDDDGGASAVMEDGGRCDERRGQGGARPRHDACDDAMHDGGNGPIHGREGGGMGDEQEYEEEADVFGHGGGLDNDEAVHGMMEATGADRAKRRRLSAEMSLDEDEGDDGRRACGDDAASMDNVAEGIGPETESGGGDSKGGEEGAQEEEQRVRAKSTSTSAFAAREGPGDDHLACVTAVAAEPEAGNAAAAVEADGRVALLGNWETAHEDVRSDCGEATRPPDGRVAPSEDSELVTSEPRGREVTIPMAMSSAASGGGPRVRQISTSPQRKPRSLGAGPSKMGMQCEQEKGSPPRRRKERRRGGSEAPAARISVARGDDAATEPRVREQPQGGWTRHEQSARSSGCVEGGSSSAEAVRGAEGEDGRQGGSACSAEAARSSTEERNGGRGGESAAEHGRMHGHRTVREEAERGNCRSTPSGSTRRQERGEARGDQGRQEHHEERGLRVHRGARGHVFLHEAAGHDDDRGRHRVDHQDREWGPHRRGEQRDRGVLGQARRSGGQGSRGSACEERNNEEDAAWVPMWRRRPAWLYLPHQSAEGLIDDVRAKRRRTEEYEGSPLTTEIRRSFTDNRATESGNSDPGEGEAGNTGQGRRRGPAEQGPGDGGERPGDAREIQGRGTSLGALARHLGAGDAAHRGRADGHSGDAADVDHQPIIRGPSNRPGAGLMGRSLDAQARLDAKNAHLRTSLQQHADRVRKRASGGQLDAGRHTAQERLAAIRRRVAEKTKAGQGESEPPLAMEERRGHLDGKEGQVGHVEGGAERQQVRGDQGAVELDEVQEPADARCREAATGAADFDVRSRAGKADEGRPSDEAARAPGSGAASGSSSARRNELRYQIHQVHGRGGIQDAPACADGGGDSARSNEARRAAWHEVGLGTRQPR